MRHVLIAATAIAVIGCPASAQEHAPNGIDLIEACRVIASGTTPTPENTLQVGICRGELEALNWYAPGAFDTRLRSCAPSEITSQQLAKTVVDYFDRIRDRLREPFEGLALEAFAHTWPCAEDAEDHGWFGKWQNKKEPSE
jgi:hypothetical protein